MLKFSSHCYLQWGITLKLSKEKLVYSYCVHTLIPILKTVPCLCVPSSSSWMRKKEFLSFPQKQKIECTKNIQNSFWLWHHGQARSYGRAKKQTSKCKLICKRFTYCKTESFIYFKQILRCNFFQHHFLKDKKE